MDSYIQESFITIGNDSIGDLLKVSCSLKSTCPNKLAHSNFSLYLNVCCYALGFSPFTPGTSEPLLGKYGLEETDNQNRNGTVG